MQTHNPTICVNCGSANTARVSTLYHNARPADIDPQALRQASEIGGWNPAAHEGPSSRQEARTGGLVPDGRAAGSLEVLIPDMPVVAGSRNVLAKKLAPPVHPASDPGLQRRIGLIGVVAFLGAALISAATIPFGGWQQSLAIFALLFVAGIIIASIIVRNWRAAATRRIPQWEKALERWEEMFYCADCDHVFIPWERVALPASQMKQLAYPGEPLKIDGLKDKAKDEVRVELR